MSDKHESFDGFSVVMYDGKFSGSFDLDDETAREIGLDDVVTLVVTARISGAAHSETKTGDIKRTNVFKVSTAQVLTPKTASLVVDLVDNGPEVPVPSAAALGIDVGPVDAVPVAPAVEQTGPEVTPRPSAGDPVLARFLDVT